MKISKPRRVTRTYTQHLVAEPARVFPLLCPVREAEWIEGWDPVEVWSESGIAEPDCVFTSSTGDGDAVWFITQCSPEIGAIEMLKITPGVTACRLVIALASAPGGSEAEVTYSHTSLGPAGDDFVDGFTSARYREFMEDWESRLNHYLAKGEMLHAADG